jgi:hypothetical protein
VNNQERKSSSSSTAFLGKSSDITASPVTSSNLRIGEGQLPQVPVKNDKNDKDGEYQKQVEEAVNEEQMLSSSLHSESALDDDDDDDEMDDERVFSQHTNANTTANSASTGGMIVEEEDDKDDDDGKDEIDGMLRTGNERFRRGSRRLSRLSSTLGEGITAHWKRSSPSTTTTSISTSKDESNNGDAALSRAMSQAQEAQKAPPPAPPAQAQSSSPSSLSAQPTRKGQSPSKSPQRQPNAADLPAGLTPIKKKSKALANSAIGTGEIEEKLSPIEQAKKSAAYRAVDVHVKPHHRVIGIGSGSTVPYVVDRLLEQGEEANRKRWVSTCFFASPSLLYRNHRR